MFRRNYRNCSRLCGSRFDCGWRSPLYCSQLRTGRVAAMVVACLFAAWRAARPCVARCIISMGWYLLSVCQGRRRQGPAYQTFFFISNLCQGRRKQGQSRQVCGLCLRHRRDHGTAHWLLHHQWCRDSVFCHEIRNLFIHKTETIKYITSRKT